MVEQRHVYLQIDLHDCETGRTAARYYLDGIQDSQALQLWCTDEIWFALVARACVGDVFITTVDRSRTAATASWGLRRLRSGPVERVGPGRDLMLEHSGLHQVADHDANTAVDLAEEYLPFQAMGRTLRVTTRVLAVFNEVVTAEAPPPAAKDPLMSTPASASASRRPAAPPHPEDRSKAVH